MMAAANLRINTTISIMFLESPAFREGELSLYFSWRAH